jgi:DNA-binding transcriptional MerR regulator/methylmalonyl-CoA mutase cobalamin-binding subunit
MDVPEPFEAPPAARLYSIQEVSRMLDLKPGTLRAWERRFGIPRPRRAGNGYRLYSASDIAVLRQLMARLDSGARIGYAVEGLNAVAGAGPSLEMDGLRYRLAEALLGMDERRASDALREALALHPVETVLAEIVEPMQAWIGDEWEAGRVSVGVEHFASAVFVRQLVALNFAAPDTWRPGRTLAACLPGEQHEIGLLALTVGLRRRGWDVIYLGANLPLDELERSAAGLRPAVILLSATSALDDAQVSAIADVSRRLASSEAELVLGGPAVRGRQADVSPATVLDGSFSHIVSSLETILVRRTSSHVR